MTTLPTRISEQLSAAGLDPDDVIRVVATALAEDLNGGPDVTTESTIPANTIGRAELVARDTGVIAGLVVAEAVFELVATAGGPAGSVPAPAGSSVRPDPPATRIQVVASCNDGELVTANQVLMTVEGPLRSILTAERTALNLLSHMSGIATLTRQWVDAVAGTGARIRDTRKTLPGLRALEKYAVRCGGGVNHRMSLSDAALIKDNHLAVAGSVAAAYRALRAATVAATADAPRRAAFPLPIEVECDNLDQVAEAVAAGVDLILLDNFSPGDMARAVRVVAGRALLEASGGLRLETAAQVAATGVDFLAVGALTHSAPGLDVGLDVVGSLAATPGEDR
jgi:nicotinate-nucleotide pyrophosphorylase (carboxylating)